MDIYLPIWHFLLLIGLCFASNSLVSIIRHVYIQAELGNEEDCWLKQGFEGVSNSD